MTASIVSNGLPLEPGQFVLAAANAEDDLIFACPRCGRHAVLRFGARGDGHQLTARHPLTIAGSIICPARCGAHYFVTNGSIVWSSDAQPSE